MTGTNCTFTESLFIATYCYLTLSIFGTICKHCQAVFCKVDIF